MRDSLTFDCYGTLLDTSPLYDFIGNVAQNHGLSSQKAIYVFSSYEDRLMYGHDFLPYEKLLKEVLAYCDMEMNRIFLRKSMMMSSKFIEILNHSQMFYRLCDS